VILRLLIAAVVLPGLVAAVVGAAARFLPASSRLRPPAALVALVLGYLAAQLAAVGAPSFPPIDTTQGLFYLALVCGVVGLLMGAAPVRTWIRTIATLAIVGSMLGLTLHPLIRHQWSGGAAVVATLTLGAAAIALWWSYAALAARLPIVVVRASWIAVSAAAGLLLVLARTALLGQLAASLAVTLLAVTIAGPPTSTTVASGDESGRRQWRPAASAKKARPPQPSMAQASALVFLAPMLHTFVLNGVLYAELGLPAAVAVALAPLAAASALVLDRRRPVARLIAAALMVIIVLTPFVAHAAIEYAADDGYYYDYDG
jgi:hypothetical protein